MSFVFLFFSFLHAQEVQILKSKQEINNIRFMQKSDEFIYYSLPTQGNLHLNKGFLDNKVISSSPYTHYNLYASSHKKKIIVEADSQHFINQSIWINNKLSILDFGGKIASDLGEGRFPLLHLNDSWISFVDFNLKKIDFKNISLSQVVTYPLSQLFEPFFVPARVMLSDSLALLSSQNSFGEENIVSFDFNKKEKKLIKKFSKGTHIDLCETSDQIVLSEFSDKIIQITSWKKNESIAKNKTIYKDSVNLGYGLECYNNKIYFIAYPLKNPEKTAIIELTLDGKKKALTTPGKFSQFSIMDERLILNANGAIYYISL